MEVARRAQASAHGRRLFVSGVAAGVKKTDLQQEFGEFGHVTEIELPLTARGVAFVEFDNARDAEEALAEVTGRKLKGMVLKVKMADVQNDGKSKSETGSKTERPRVPAREARSRSRRGRGESRRSRSRSKEGGRGRASRSPRRRSRRS
eukprot:gb/GFBE01042095.1/.p1 GENE.gb/GFBE01042095.1/~~gb/GFBE01042095.1/.p1  ORF type:complete len:149 (+),score=17.96 gb/GFBE01042095.1/:1-447(+)